MKHPDNHTHVQLRGEDDSWIEEYYVKQMGHYTGACITGEPGKQFSVKIWFQDCKPYDNGAKASLEWDKDEGFVVIVGCGHGTKPPGGFDQVQYFWIKSDDLKTKPHSIRGYEIWKEGPQGFFKVDSIWFTMPAPSNPTGFQMYKGAVTIHVRRGKFLNKHSSLTSNTTMRNVVLPARLVTDPPDTRAHKSMEPRKSQTLRHRDSDDPLVIARKWFQERDGVHGNPYIFEFQNLGCIDPIKAGLKRSPDSGEQDPDHKYGSECGERDAEAEHSGSEFDPNELDSECWLKSRRDYSAYTRSRAPTSSGMAAGSIGSAKRKRGASAEAEMQEECGPGKSNGRKLLPDGSIAVLTSEDQDDEEILPDRKDRIEVKGFFARFRRPDTDLKMESESPESSLSPSWTHEQLDEQNRSTAEPEAENLYTDSRHPSLYNEPEEEPMFFVAPEALDREQDQQPGLEPHDPEFEDLYTDSRHPSLYNEPEEELADHDAFAEALDLLASTGDRSGDVQENERESGQEQVAGSQQHREQEDSEVARDQTPAIMEQANNVPVQSQRLQSATGQVREGVGSSAEGVHRRQVSHLARQHEDRNGYIQGGRSRRLASPQPPAVIDLTADSDGEQAAKGKKAALAVRKAGLKVKEEAQKIREEAQAILEAELALQVEEGERAKEKRERAKEDRRQADADREEMMRIKMELKVESTE
ncbi:hypothetical protein LTS10_010569 [Elasticomyces elasticus]|nr:hypothetical protein LTS10_010569 [Elasticomyces elasticus]